MQVLQLSDAEISALPPGQQEQVRQLVRARYFQMCIRL